MSKVDAIRKLNWLSVRVDEAAECKADAPGHRNFATEGHASPKLDGDSLECRERFRALFRLRPDAPPSARRAFGVAA